MKIILSFLLFFMAFSGLQAQHYEESLLQKAREIHEEVITIDTHADINVENFTQQRNYTQDLPTQVNLPKMEAGGLDVAWFIVYTGQEALTAAGYDAAHENAMEKFRAIHRLVEDYAPEKIALATTAKQVREIHGSGKKVAMIGVENAYPIGQDLQRVKKFYDLGARYMSLSHQGHSQLSDSNTGEADDQWLHGGLSELGKAVIAQMNRYGMMIDVSHPSKEAIKQMFQLSRAPLIASHSSARALCDHSRNLDDELLLLFKKHGGVVQTVAFSAYVDRKKHEAFQKARQELYQEKARALGLRLLDRKSLSELSEQDRQAYQNAYKEITTASEEQVERLRSTIEPVGVRDFVDHIDYMVNLIGVDHVGISSDFDGGGGIYGWKDASESLNVTAELVKRGYNKEDIAKLWGENLLRVMEEVESVAREIQRS